MNSQSSPCVQIHHTGRDHRITSCQDTSGTIYVLGSMNSKSFTTSVQIQMSTGADPGFKYDEFAHMAKIESSSLRDISTDCFYTQVLC
jgi:hypothetical protein